MRNPLHCSLLRPIAISLKLFWFTILSSILAHRIIFLSFSSEKSSWFLSKYFFRGFLFTTSSTLSCFSASSFDSSLATYLKNQL